MKHVRFDPPFLAAMLVLAISSPGCQKEPTSDSTPATPAATARLGPEESFELIVATFRRRVEDTPVGFVLQDNGGRTMMTGKNKVSHKLIPPAKEGDQYKAVITVDSQSSYSINRSKNGADDDSRDQEPTDDNNDVFVENVDDSGAEIFDPELISQPGGDKDRGRSAPADELVAQRPDRQTREYELVYDNGRWALTTQLDQTTEQSIQNAFNQALKSQN